MICPLCQSEMERSASKEYDGKKICSFCWKTKNGIAKPPSRPVISQKLKAENLSAAGWMSLVSAGVIVLFITMVVQQHDIFATALKSVMAGLSIYVLMVLKKLLNQHANFTATNWHINFLILVNLGFCVLYAFATPLESINEFSKWVGLILLIPIGIVRILFGVKLYQCEQEYYGYFHSYAFLNVIVGLGMVTVIAAIIALVVTIAVDIFLGLMLLNASGDRQISV